MILMKSKNEVKKKIFLDTLGFKSSKTPKNNFNLTIRKTGINFKKSQTKPIKDLPVTFNNKILKETETFKNSVLKKNILDKRESKSGGNASITRNSSNTSNIKISIDKKRNDLPIKIISKSKGHTNLRLSKDIYTKDLNKRYPLPELKLKCENNRISYDIGKKF